jgi:DNA-binding transcriptional ArsR family regulator
MIDEKEVMMMPLEVIDSTDPLARLIEFRRSAVYEMIISLRLLLDPTRTHRQWVVQTVADLTTEFMKELEVLYKPFMMGHQFLELGVDYPNHDDVKGFINYVRRMPPDKFVFYILGRVLPHKDLAATDLSKKAVMKLIQDQLDEHYAETCYKMPLDFLLEDIPALQNRLTNLWEFYWDNALARQIPDLMPHWENAIQDRERVLNREGGEALMQSIVGRFRRLPPPLPANMPIEEVVIVPSYLLPSRAFIFYGYGNVTVLFDARLTEARVQEIESGKDTALTVLRALSDNTRLNILQVIARSHGQIHGQKIAKMLDLSPSVVSRHLTQLKDAGLLEEIPQEDRKIYYRIKDEVIVGLSDKLLDYIYT